MKREAKRSVLVTGGAGFIGSHLVRALLKRGKAVRVLDNFSTGYRHNLAGINGSLQVRKGDIEKPGDLRKAMRDIDTVFHLAAVSSVPQSVDQPLPTARVNVQGTWNVLEAARVAGVRRLVFISSASVYGARTTVPFRESMSLRGSSPYATSKLLGEQLCDLYLRLYGLSTTCLRLFSVYGPRQNPKSQYSNVIPALARRLLSSKAPLIYGTGKQTRDFVFVEDVVQALLRSAHRKSAVGQVINVGTGRQTSILQLLKAIQQELGTRIKPVFEPMKPGDDPRTCAHTGRCRKILGMVPHTPFSKGLKATLDWYQSSTT